MKKLKPIKTLVKELDTVFSLYIRQKYADKKGMVKCYTSGKMYHWKKIQAGHFISRRHYSLRWDERNVKPQSVGENIFNQGNAPVFAVNLMKEYGSGIIEKLTKEKNKETHLDRIELLSKIDFYKEKIKLLKK